MTTRLSPFPNPNPLLGWGKQPAISQRPLMSIALAVDQQIAKPSSFEKRHPNTIAFN
jgi:hypothetical protein